MKTLVPPVSIAAPFPPVGDEKIKADLIAWLSAYRNMNREDEVIASQHARLDLLRLAGRAGVEETLMACEAVQESGQKMTTRLHDLTLPEGLPSEDVRTLRLAIQNALLMYRHQEKWMEHQHALLTELRPYNGQIGAIPPGEFAEVAPRLYGHLRDIQTLQRLTLESLFHSGSAFGTVLTRWGLLEVVAGFG